MRSVDEAVGPRERVLNPELRGEVENFGPALRDRFVGIVRAGHELAAGEVTAAAFRSGTHAFPVPVPMPEITISMLWHPRLHADPVHGWLRGVVRGVW
jgi:DNA-binding transcriptional LysR family regulator